MANPPSEALAKACVAFLLSHPLPSPRDVYDFVQEWMRQSTNEKQVEYVVCSRAAYEMGRPAGPWTEEVVLTDPVAALAHEAEVYKRGWLNTQTLVREKRRETQDDG